LRRPPSPAQLALLLSLNAQPYSAVHLQPQPPVIGEAAADQQFPVSSAVWRITSCDLANTVPTALPTGSCWGARRSWWTSSALTDFRAAQFENLLAAATLTMEMCRAPSASRSFFLGSEFFTARHDQQPFVRPPSIADWFRLWRRQSGPLAIPGPGLVHASGERWVMAVATNSQMPRSFFSRTGDTAFLRPLATRLCRLRDAATTRPLPRWLGAVGNVGCGHKALS